MRPFRAIRQEDPPVVASNEPSRWHELDYSILHRILMLLEFPEFCSIAQTCRAWRITCSHEHIWEHFYRRSICTAAIPSVLCTWRARFFDTLVQNQTPIYWAYEHKTYANSIGAAAVRHAVHDAIEIAIIRGEDRLVLYNMCRYGVGVNDRHPMTNKSILERAVVHGHLPVVSAVLSAKADPNTLTCAGIPVLSVATHTGNIGVLHTLMACGANPNYVVRCCNYVPPLHTAVQMGREDLVVLLLAWYADPNARRSPCGSTALHDAVSFQKPRIAGRLLSAGANNSIANADGHTPLSMALVSHSPEMISAFLYTAKRPEVISVQHDRLYELFGQEKTTGILLQTSHAMPAECALRDGQKENARMEDWNGTCGEHPHGDIVDVI